MEDFIHVGKYGDNDSPLSNLGSMDPAHRRQRNRCIFVNRMLHEVIRSRAEALDEFKIGGLLRSFGEPGECCKDDDAID